MVDPSFVRWGLPCIGVLLLLYRLLRYGMRPRDYPPGLESFLEMGKMRPIEFILIFYAGPPTLPVVGNLHVFPKTGIHIQYDKWLKECRQSCSRHLLLAILIDYCRRSCRLRSDGWSSIDLAGNGYGSVRSAREARRHLFESVVYLLQPLWRRKQHCS